MTSLHCVLARPLIVAGVLDGKPIGPRVAEHRDVCLRCQATEARARATGRSLRKLELVGADAPAGLATAVVSKLDEPTPPPARRSVGVTFALALGVAGFVVFLRRIRPR
jgi:ferric-dicitrate binding protein FerR (iron transport regulator)